MTNLFVNSPAVSEGRQAQADGKQKDAKEPKKEKPNKAAAEHVLTLQTRKRNNMWGEPQDCSYFFNVLWLWICLSFSFLMFLSCSCFFRIIFPCPFKDLNLVLAVSDIFSHIFPYFPTCWWRSRPKRKLRSADPIDPIDPIAERARPAACRSKKRGELRIELLNGADLTWF